jgi:uncharacterized protein YpuA (DUF1002 family)
MKSIKQILMDRDDMTAEEAEDLIADVREELAFAIETNDLAYAEDIMYGDLGLEMDYIFELLI